MLAMLVISGAAMAQRNAEPEPPQIQHVTVGGSVFGGGNLAPVAGNTSVLLNQQGATIGADVYGGGALANVGTDNTNTTTVNILDGIIEGNVYGGGLGDSTATGYDGSQNVAALVYGKVYVNIGAAGATQTDATGNATIGGSVFGCNNINGTPLDSVFVNIYKTHHQGANSYPTAPVDGWTAESLEDQYDDQDYAITAVYGGGNKASYKPTLNTSTSTPKCTTVHVYYCSENTVQTVYGGGNAADVGISTRGANTRLIIDGGCYEQLFGGGNGYSATGNHGNPSAANYNPGANIYGTATTEIHAGLFKQIFGGSNQYGNINTVALNIDKDPDCDEMILESFCGGNEADMTGGDINATILCSDIHIGTLYGGSNKADILKDGSGNGGNVTLTVLGGVYDYVFGGSKGYIDSNDPNNNIDADIAGNVTLNLHGGTIKSAFGGSDVNGNIGGNITVNVLDTVAQCQLQVDTIYGAGRDAAYTPADRHAVSPLVKIQHATVGHDSGNTAVPGCVFGGGKGSTATVTAHPKVIIGELAIINDPQGNPINTVATVTGDVYGGGDAANVVGGTTVLVQKCNSSAKYVYGGGNAAHVDSTKVYVTGGTIDTIFGGGHGSLSPSVAANVTGNDTISITGGTIGKVFSGSNLNGSIGGRMALNIDKSSDLYACDMKIGEVYGGGNMAAGKAGTITIGCTGDLVALGPDEHYGYDREGIGTVYGGGNMADIGTNENHSNIHLIIQNGIVENVFGGNNTSGTIYGTIQVDIDSVGDCSTNWYVGNVYGGGNLAPYTGSPAVNILRGTVSQNVYGGGKGSTAVVTGTPSVTVGDLAVGHEDYKATVLGDVYGGGDAAHVATGTPMVLVQKCNSKVGNDVYGGGNAADVPATSVTVTGGTISGAVFGGGHGDKDATPTPLAANVTGNTSVTINGGVINQVFGGSNSNGTIGGTISVVVNKEGTCEMHITEVYGGGNFAASNAGIIDIECTGADDMIDYVYGGANQADIGTSEASSNITLNITGGRIGNVFGGNNNSGTIHGTITVNVEWDGSCANNYLGNVYGGGNLAAYTGSPEVNIKNGTVSGSVFGGGYGATAVVTGAPLVTVGDLTEGHSAYVAIVNTDVYGGGDAANVSTGTPVVLIQKCNTEILRDVYGGGNAANVPATSVTVTGGTISGSVFGGGHGNKDAEPALEANVTGNTSVTINGGTINKVFGGSNSKGTIGGTIGVLVEKSGTSCPMHITEVYGGGNFAASNAGNITVNCTGTFTDWNNYEGIEYLYGGANQADVTGPITLNITKGTIKNVFGGNNTSGTISNGITVNVTKADNCMHLYNVYGAGNVAAYTGSPAVNINHGTIDNNVYGGGKGSAAVVTGNPEVTIGDNNIDHVAVVTGDVYGGGDAAAVTGTTTVEYNDNNASSTVGNLFGGGNAAGVTGTATVNMTLGTVTTGIYGGCNSEGDVEGKITVNVTGGTIGSSTNLASYITADVYGGGYGANTETSGDVEVNINGSSVNIYGDVYGGSALGNVNDEATDKTTVNILDGTLHSVEETITGGFKVYHGGNVYGGGLGNGTYAAAVNGLVTVNIGSGTVEPSGTYAGYTTTTNTGSAIIQGNVYGCNNANGSPRENVTVNIFSTGHPTGTGIDESGYAIANVFGGGNQANFQVAGKTATVNIYGCDNTIQRVFGGGNAAATNTVYTMIQGGRMDLVFGGGNGERGLSYAANVAGDVYLGIHGGSVGQFFGGSNQNGTISNAINITVDNNGPCESLDIEEFFCGGNFADVYGNVITDIPCSGGMNVHNLYGGCNQANVINGDVVLNVYGGTYINVYGGSKGDLQSLGSGHVDKRANITGSVTLNLYGGSIENVYGGSNVNGNIGEDIVVNVIDVEDGTCPLYITNIYGGSNLTDYVPDSLNHVEPITDPNRISPVVNVVHAKYGISGNVYGGSRGDAEALTPTKVMANPRVNIGYDATSMNSYIPLTYLSTYSALLAAPRAIISGSVFGGGDAAQVQGNTAIFLRNKAKVFGNVYGGGNMGEVTGNTKVIVNGANE